MGFRVLGFWGFGVLGFWGFGGLGFWGFGVLGLGFRVEGIGFRVWGLELKKGSRGERTFCQHDAADTAVSNAHLCLTSWPKPESPEFKHPQT